MRLVQIRLKTRQKEGVAVIKFEVNERVCDGASNREVECVSYPSKITNR